MVEDIRVRVAGRSFSFGGTTYGHGDEFEAPEAVLEKHPRTLERVAEEAAGAESDEDEIDDRAYDLADENYQVAVSAVNSGEADAYLDDLEAVDDRMSVQTAIEDRRADQEE